MRSILKCKKVGKIKMYDELMVAMAGKGALLPPAG